MADKYRAIGKSRRDLFDSSRFDGFLSAGQHCQSNSALQDKVVVD